MLNEKASMAASTSALENEIISSSSIEGIVLDRDSVRSSIMERLGLSTEGLCNSDRSTEGAVSILIDAVVIRPYPDYSFLPFAHRFDYAGGARGNVFAAAVGPESLLARLEILCTVEIRAQPQSAFTVHECFVNQLVLDRKLCRTPFHAGA